MKLGVCTGSENFKIARKLGYAYWEFSLAAMAAMNDEEFRDLQKRQKLSLRPVYSCNGMLPGSVPCVGPDASDDAILEYLHHALTRAQKLGVKTVVFGSGASRRVPEGWTHEQAWRQLVHFLTLAGNTAEKYGITIAIEPLRRQECNIINYVSEATALASIVNLPNVGVLGDTFHMNAVGEPYEALAQAGSLLKHVHISHSPERTYPCSDDGEDYAELFKVLKSIGYEGGISIEAGTSNFESDGAAAFACLENAMKEAGIILMDKTEEETLRSQLRRRVMDCPFFISGTILPVPGCIYGSVPSDVLYQRAFNALVILDLGKEDIKQVLAESYQDECDMIRSIIRAYGIAEEQGDAAFRPALLQAAQEYLAKPETERKTWLLL